MSQREQELIAMLKVMLDQVEDDPRACQFFDLRWLDTVRAKVKECEGGLNAATSKQ